MKNPNKNPDPNATANPNPNATENFDIGMHLIKAIRNPIPVPNATATADQNPNKNQNLDIGMNLIKAIQNPIPLVPNETANQNEKENQNPNANTKASKLAEHDKKYMAEQRRQDDYYAPYENGSMCDDGIPEIDTNLLHNLEKRKKRNTCVYCQGNIANGDIRTHLANCAEAKVALQKRIAARLNPVPNTANVPASPNPNPNPNANSKVDLQKRIHQTANGRRQNLVPVQNGTANITAAVAPTASPNQNPNENPSATVNLNSNSNKTKLQNLPEWPIACFADGMHLIKSIRNALLTNKVLTIHKEWTEKLELDSDKVCWSHIVQLYEFCAKRKLKIASHIKRKFINIGHFNKMKVLPAMAVCSKATGHALRWVHKYYPEDFGPEVLTTAVFCEKVGEWSDIVNNYHRNMAFHADKPEKNEESFSKMDKFQEFYGTMKLHKDQSDDEFKPTQRGVVMTNASIKWSVNELFTRHGFKYIPSALFSNDPVEQFHGDERSIQRNPTAKQFLDNAKLISVSHYMGHVKDTNHAVDENSKFMTCLRELQTIHQEEEEAACKDLNIDMDFINSNQLDLAESVALAYLAGYFLGKILIQKRDLHHPVKEIKCAACFKAFIIDYESDDQLVNSLITEKEYKPGALTRPSRFANAIFTDIEKLFRGAELAFSKQNNLTIILTDKMMASVLQKFPDVPKCHLRLIFRRFANARLNFDANFIDNQFIEKNKKIIEGKANASKTSKGVSLK